jgi:hypothetical protein
MYRTYLFVHTCLVFESFNITLSGSKASGLHNLFVFSVVFLGLSLSVDSRKIMNTSILYVLEWLYQPLWSDMLLLYCVCFNSIMYLLFIIFTIIISY